MAEKQNKRKKGCQKDRTFGHTESTTRLRPLCWKLQDQHQGHSPLPFGSSAALNIDEEDKPESTIRKVLHPMKHSEEPFWEMEDGGAGSEKAGGEQEPLPGDQVHASKGGPERPVRPLL